MTIEEMIEKLRYKANNIKAHIEPEFFNDVADRLEKQVAKKPIQQSTDEKTHHKCVCGTILRTDYTDGIRQGYIPANCSHCGQKLDRSEVE